MTSRIASRRLAEMRSHLERTRAPAARHADDSSSPTRLVAKVVIGILLVVMGLAFVALAPITIATLAALAGLSALLALVGRHRYPAPRARRKIRRWWPRADAGWGTLAVSSVALLVLALVVPRGYDVLFAALGLAAMAVLRLRGGAQSPAENDTRDALHRAVESVWSSDGRHHGAPPAGPPNASTSEAAHEDGRARFSASDRPIPREWRRRGSMERHARGIA